jgi:5-methyltetrahydropteroyltriglutamate--homocysteine methyltransferase
MWHHGEFERNDMVEYFEQNNSTDLRLPKNGWVQLRRCAKTPPVIYGDVSRPNAMTVNGQLTLNFPYAKWVKGMLTGLVTTSLQWSVRNNDQPRSETCTQINRRLETKLSICENAGIKISNRRTHIRDCLRKEEWATILTGRLKPF